MKKLDFFLCMIFTLLLFPKSTSAQTPTVEFKCNMSLQMKDGQFNAATDSIWVRGNFNSWSGFDFELKDPDGDSVYSAIFTNFAEGDSLVFRFVHSPDVWEPINSNRKYTVTDGTNVYECFWEDDSIYIPKKFIHIAFSVNMKYERLAGLFNSDYSYVAIGGSSCGWCIRPMTSTVENPDSFFVKDSIQLQLGSKFSFKFYYEPGVEEKDYLTDSTQKERYFVISQNVFESGIKSYSAIFNNDSLEITPYPNHSIVFTCNTNGAAIINAPVGTEVKTVHIAGGTPPLQWPSGSWPNEDSTKMIRLYDDGTHNDAVAGDKIFTNSITFPSYAQLTVIYKYSANWGLTSNGGANDNETLVGGDKILKLGRYTSSGNVRDTFGIVHITDITKVEKLDNTIPTTFKLEQNFPNPFNPETVISWQLAAGGFVTLKIYDVLGNEVATLVNEEQQAGSYQVEFSSKNNELSSGVYFYQLRAGDFVQTKKMILLR